MKTVKRLCRRCGIRWKQGGGLCRQCSQQPDAVWTTVHRRAPEPVKADWQPWQELTAGRRAARAPEGR